MRVGLDGYPLSEPRTGVGHYTLELARALALNFPADQFELVSPAPFDPSVTEQISSEALPNLRLVNAKSSSIRGHWWGVGLPLYIKQAAFDLFHGTNFELPLWKSRRNVLTIHDLSTLLHSRTHQPRLVRRARLRLPLAVKLASAIITPTESVKREVCEHLKVKPQKITAIHEAPRRSFQPMSFVASAKARKRLGVEDEFLLFVGTLEPRKNLLTLLEAFELILRQTSLRPQLVLAGGEGWLMDETFSFIRKAGLSDRLCLTGYLEDEDLCALYSSCKAFIYPSVYEGFGLPPLEAMACGAPVIAARNAALQETLGGAAILFEPTDVELLAGKIVGMFSDEKQRQRMTSTSLKHAAKFSWEKAARLTYEVYQSVVTPPR